MSEETLKARITAEMKTAMRAKDKPRLSTIRLIQSEIKRIEVDERIELDDSRVLAILDKMSKQRRDSLSQFKDAGRDDLAAQEQSELDVIAEFLPAALTEEELQVLIDQAVANSGAQAMSDMGKVMGILKPQVQGRADMGVVSKHIKARLSQ
ncbi:MAG: GatB/YqeY domain-containing protein [Porticoccaceae bacterium]|nr:GatB/YqeY domain-containing protein [Porticoccaceae bacterium]